MSPPQRPELVTRCCKVTDFSLVKHRLCDDHSHCREEAAFPFQQKLQLPRGLDDSVVLSVWAEVEDKGLGL